LLSRIIKPFFSILQRRPRIFKEFFMLGRIIKIGIFKEIFLLGRIIKIFIAW
jgi:hypothetical protein